MNEDNGTMLCCASCGIAEIDDVKLKSCDECDLVRYCSDECLTDHKSQHEDACKKRVAELRDELLFEQPESTHLGDCPICMLPLPLGSKKRGINDCCSKVICCGCAYADIVKMGEGRLKKYKCAFCRALSVVTEEETHKQRMKRVEANDPVAIRREGDDEYERGDYSGAFDYYAKAAELGDAEAHSRLAAMYQDGHGVEKDSRKERYHLEEAAIGGHPQARHSLGVYEIENDNAERGLKHFVIAATQGYDGSIKPLMNAFKLGFMGKEDLAAALRAHQVAVDATKSPQRKIADDLFREGGR